MNKKVRNMVYAAIIAALYFAVTHLQNIIIPGSATWAIQFRISEALCILACFTPSAISGLSIGCLLFNLTYAGALPLDFLIGSLATLIATLAMWHLRGLTIRGIPFFALWMPALANAILVGGELTLYIGGAFALNAVYVAIGEAAVLLTLGTLLFCAMKRRKLDTLLFT